MNSRKSFPMPPKQALRQTRLALGKAPRPHPSHLADGGPEVASSVPIEGPRTPTRRRNFEVVIITPSRSSRTEKSGRVRPTWLEASPRQDQNTFEREWSDDWGDAVESEDDFFVADSGMSPGCLHLDEGGRSR